MSTDAVAVIGFVSLFILMLLRVPIGMALGLVGVTGFGYLTSMTPALKIVGHTTMRTVTDFNYAVVPLFLLMGSFATTSGMSRELFRAANAFIGHLRGGLRRFRRDLRLLGGDRRNLLARRLSRNAPLQLSGELLGGRHRCRRHARHHDPAVHRACDLRHHHRAGHRQAVHRRRHSRHPRCFHVRGHGVDHRLDAAGFPARRRKG
jgi:hypothetical protein